MPKTRTISPFLAAMPGVDDRILRDVGLDAEGNLVDKDDPRVRRLGRLGLFDPLVELLSTAGRALRSRSSRAPAPVAKCESSWSDRNGAYEGASMTDMATSRVARPARPGLRARQLPALAIEDKGSESRFAIHDRTIVGIWKISPSKKDPVPSFVQVLLIDATP